MLDFIAAVFVFNLLFFIFLILIRNFIPLNITTLAIAVIISCLFTMLIPYMIAHIPYPLVIEIFFCFILICAIALALMDKKLKPAIRIVEKEASNEIITELDMGTSIEQLETGSLTDAVQEEMFEEVALQEPETTEQQGQSEQETPVITTFGQENNDQLFQTPEGLLPGLVVSQIEAPLSLLEANVTETTAIVAPSKLAASATDIDNPEYTPKVKGEGEILESAEELDAQEPLPKEADLGYIKEENTQPEPVPDYSPAISDTILGHTDNITCTQDPIPANTRPAKLQQLIVSGFSSKKAGHYEQAIMNFNAALQLKPASKLAVLIMVEISEIYKLIDQPWQAAEILKILLITSQGELDALTINEVKNKIKLLQNAA